jgi:hypothetical protein
MKSSFTKTLMVAVPELSMLTTSLLAVGVSMFGSVAFELPSASQSKASHAAEGVSVLLATT